MNDKLKNKEAQETPQNKLCVDLIPPYVTRRNEQKKYKYNIHHHDRPYNRMVRNNSI